MRRSFAGLATLGATALGFAVMSLSAACGSGGSTTGGGGSGASTSSTGGGGTCVPETEICDGQDNDCNGEVDEGCACSAGQTQECYTGDTSLVGIGACAMGTQTCDQTGTWGACEGEVLPSAEQCDGQDNDCNDEVDEGFGTVTCGLGVCQQTVDECVAGVPNPCVPGTPEPNEACNGVDDTCDGTVDEGCTCTDGTTQPCYTGAPATKNVGECSDGVQTCQNGQWGACEGDVLPTAEICNGLDDNCDGTEDDGDPGGGSICNTGLSGICGPGVEHCVPDGNGGAAVECVANQSPGPEICDGLDNDCQASTPDGAAEPSFGQPCDGPDSDLCTEGNVVCNGGVLSCSDNTGSTLDLCGGGDQDCDPSSPDGSEDPLNGVPCDGGDSDLCNEGTYSCSGGMLVCSDNTGSTSDVCDGADNDCDPSSPDGSEDPQNGQACDGGDSDLCAEGTYSCSGGMLSCSDNTSSTLDLCGGGDQDCDPSSPDGSEDPQNGQACDGPDTDLCNEGTYSCSGGTLVCSDNTSSTTELCNGGIDDDCDGQIDEGFTRNDNPTCSGGTFGLGTVSGDTGSDVVTDSWYNEEFDVVTITEDSTSSLSVNATAVLTVPAGVDYDLYAYCDGCGGSFIGSSTITGTTGHTEVLEFRKDDTIIIDDSYSVIIEIRHKSSSVCAYWTLNVYGNTNVANTTCN